MTAVQSAADGAVPCLSPDALQRLAAALARAATIAEVADAVVHEGVPAVGAQTAGVWVVDREDDMLALVASFGYSPELREAFARVPVTSPLPIAHALRGGDPIWLQSRAQYRSEYPTSEPETRDLNSARDLSFVSMPLVVEGRGLGVISFVFAVERRFDETDRHFFWMIGRLCAQALARAQAFDDERRARKLIENLQVATAALSQAVTVADVARAVVERAMDTFGADLCGLWVVDDDGIVRALHDQGLADERDHFRRLPLDAHLPVTDVIRTGAPVILPDAAAQDRAYPELGAMLRAAGRQRYALVALPLLPRRGVDGGAAFGALSLAFADGRALLQDERRTLEALAQQCEIALSRSMAHDRADREQRRFGTLVAASSQVVFTADGSGRPPEDSPSWRALTGQTLESWRAGEAFDAVHPDDLPAVRTAWQESLQARRYFELEFRLRRRDGVFIPVVGRAAPLLEKDGAVREWIGTLSDVSERRAAEQARQRSDAHLRILAEASAQLGSTLDYERTLKNVVALVVPALADFAFFDVVEPTGAVRRTAIARQAEKQAVLDRSAWTRSGRDDLNVCALSSGKVGFHPVIDDAFLKRMASSEEHLAVLRRLELCAMLTVPCETRGELKGALTLCMGESRRRYAESDLFTTVDLARRAAMAVDNARLFAERGEAVRARDEFLSIAGHELNTPIAALKMQLYALRRGGGSPERTQVRMMAAERQVDLIAKLVGQLLDVARITAGRMTLEPETLDLASLLREVVDRFDDERERSGTVVRVTAPSVTGQWDRLRVDQVITNLLGNAIKYGRGRPIDLTLEARDGRARITVSDQGIGIPRDKLGILFKQFERAVSRNYAGFGLGLWISRQIVEAGGGSLTVQSEVDVGSTFTVELPIERPRD